MSLEMNNARLTILREYYGTIHIEGELEDEIVVRIQFRSPKMAEELYNELVIAEETEE